MVDHYFSEKPESKLMIKSVNVKVRGFDLKMKLASGTFASKRLDKGSVLLAENMQIKANDVILDLGCGSGLIGIIASFLTRNTVYMVDVNKRACEISKVNAEQNHAKVKILCGNMFDPVKNLRFDTILLNPPQTAGNKVCFEMIEQAFRHLKKTGTLQIVARHNKGGKSLSERMRQEFGNVETVAKKGGYRIYVSQKGL